MTYAPSYPLTDRALAQRLERTEGSANAAFVEARAARTPSSGATWIDVGGTYAMFDGVDSPITQTFGLGVFTNPTDAQLDELEAFFDARGAATHHETCPLADAALLALLPARGYRPIEQSTVLHRPPSLPDDAQRPASPDVHVRRTTPDEAALWAATSAGGWSMEHPELGAMVEALGLVSASSRGTTCFVAECEGVPIATGAIAIHGGVGLLAGASTLPAWRRRGAQSALLAARLAFAAAEGCDLAMMAAAPGSSSQCNAERQGFRIAYTRTKWMRPPI